MWGVKGQKYPTRKTWLNKFSVKISLYVFNKLGILLTSDNFGTFKTFFDIFNSVTISASKN